MSRAQDHPKLIARLLSSKDSDLAIKYEFIAHKLESVLQSFPNASAAVIAYDVKHFKDVEATVEYLLTDAAKDAFSVEEIFLLFCAIQFCRIGLFYEREPNEEITAILQDFPQRTAAFLNKYHEEFDLNKHEEYLLQQICFGFVNEGFGQSQRNHFLHRAEIRIPLLAALLHLSNFFDSNINTVIAYILKRHSYTLSSLRELLRANDISGVDIDCVKWKLELFVTIDMAESKKLWASYESDLKLEFDRVKSIMEDNGLHYSSIKITPDVRTTHRNQELVDRLTNYYSLRQTQTRDTPYKYLDSFGEADNDIFFGRTYDIERYLGYIRTKALVVLYGESGVGKTSLIRAGLIPKLVEEGCMPVYGRLPGMPADIIINQTRDLIDQLGLGQQQPVAATLADFFTQQQRIGAKFVVFLDQFEMFFTDSNYEPATWREFINQLIGCLNHLPPLDLTIVLSLRRDYFAKLGEYKSRLKELYNNAFELRQLTPEEVEAAIVEPARQFGIEYEPELAKELVKDIHRGGDYNTPQIQIVCEKLASSNEAKLGRLISLDLYANLGRAEKILAEYITEELRRFEDPATQEHVKSILKQMVTSQDTKTVCTVAELAQRTRLDVSIAKNLLEHLTDRRLLRKLESLGELSFELAHEYMIKEINRWRQDKEKDRDIEYIYESIKRTLKRRETAKAAILGKDLVADIERYRVDLALNDSQKALIVLSHLGDDPGSAEKRLLIDAWVREMQAATAVTALMDALDTSDPAIYHATVRAIAAKGPETTEHLIPYLANPIWQIRQSALDVLVRIGESAPDAILDAMVALFTADDRRTRQGAVLVLAKLGPSVRDALEQRLAIADAATAALITETLTLMRLYAVER